MLQQKRKSEGFTIIEVLIVLAIAGLILLIVFLAVPALQRNSRNTSMKNDVQNVIGGIAEYQGANSGSLPTTITTANGTVTYGAGNTTSIKIQGTSSATVVTAAPTDVPNGQIQIRLQRDCADATNTRAVAAYYSIETASDKTTLQCAES